MASDCWGWKHTPQFCALSKPSRVHMSTHIMKHEEQHISKHTHKTEKQWMLMNWDTENFKSRWFFLNVTDSAMVWVQSTVRFTQYIFLMTGLITLVVAYFSFSICISGKHKMTVSVLSPLANRTGSLLRRLLPPHPHVQKCAEAGEDGASHPGWLFLSGHRQTSDPGVAECHLQLLREAKLPYWPFTSPANWDHAPSAVRGVLARLGHSYDGAEEAHCGKAHFWGAENYKVCSGSLQHAVHQVWQIFVGIVILLKVTSEDQYHISGSRVNG